MTRMNNIEFIYAKIGIICLTNDYLSINFVKKTEKRIINSINYIYYENYGLLKFK